MRIFLPGNIKWCPDFLAASKYSISVGLYNGKSIVTDSEWDLYKYSKPGENIMTPS